MTKEQERFFVEEVAKRLGTTWFLSPDNGLAPIHLTQRRTCPDRRDVAAYPVGLRPVAP